MDYQRIIEDIKEQSQIKGCKLSKLSLTVLCFQLRVWILTKMDEDEFKQTLNALTHKLASIYFAGLLKTRGLETNDCCRLLKEFQVSVNIVLIKFGLIAKFLEFVRIYRLINTSIDFF